MKTNNICIVGLGLLGGSYAMALAKNGHTITAIDKNSSALEYAAKMGIINNNGQSEHKLLQKADVVVLALYPRDILPWLSLNADYLKQGAIVTDVTGVKADIIEKAQQLIAQRAEYISCHPMAGKEVSGIENASDAMLAEANFIITPTEKNTDEAVSFIKEMAQIMGFGKISVLSVQKHDEMIGYVSQLTHAIAVCLMNAQDNTHLADYTGDSFRDLTRIARINENMWSELFILNKDILSKEIDTFCAEMQNLKGKLQKGDEEGLKQLFISSTVRRAAFDKKKLL